MRALKKRFLAHSEVRFSRLNFKKVPALAEYQATN
jgi:hypothetical protein